MKNVLSLIITLILFFILSSLGLMALKGESENLTLLEESGPKAIWLAQNLINYGTPSIEGEIPVSITHDSLYVGLLRGLLPLNIDPSSLLIVMGVLFSVFSIVYLYRYAVLLGLNALEIGLILVALITVPAFVPAAMSGSSNSLFSLLITMGVISYFKHQHNKGYGFSFSTAFLFAVASSLHVEAFLMMIVLGVGNVLCGLLNKEKEPNSSAVFVDLLNGVLLVGIFLLPAIAYHMNAINVPWPRSPDAWLALGSAGELGAEAWSAKFLSYLTASLKLLGVLTLWPGIVYGLGIVGSLLLVIRRQSVTSIHYLVMIVLTPLLAAGASMGLGSEALSPLMIGIQPILFLLGGFVICRAIHSLIPAKRIELPVVGSLETASLGIAVLFLIGLGMGSLGLKHDREATAKRIVQLSDALDKLVQSTESTIGTDRAGWVRLYTSREAVDVSGRTDLRTLGMIGFAYALDSEGWQRIAEENGVSEWYIVEEETHKSLIDSGLIETSEGESPWFYSNRLP